MWFPVLALSRWLHPLNSKDLELVTDISQCASHRQRASSPNLVSPLSSWAQAFWPPKCPQSLGSLIHLSMKLFSGHKRRPVSCAPSNDLSLCSLSLHHQTYDRRCSLRYIIKSYMDAKHYSTFSMSLLQKKKKLHPKCVDELPQSYLVQECALFRVNERSGAWDVWLVTRWKK